MSIPPLTAYNLRSSCIEAGYPFFERGDYNINTIGIRSMRNDQSGEAVSDRFNDLICVCYKVGGEWRLHKYAATTIPGLHYFEHPIMPEFGTAIMVPGHYHSAYFLGQHFGKPALQQCGMLKLYRDGNMDAIIDLDPATIQEANWSGINIHYSTDGIQAVGKWSAGCQVLAYGPNSAFYNEFLGHYRAAIACGWRNLFSYTLLTEDQLFV